MKSSLFETLPKNVTVSRKKNKKINYDNNDLNNSSAESSGENEFLKTKKLELKNNPRFLKLLQNSNNDKKFFTEKINENDDSQREIADENEKFRISKFSNDSQEEINIMNKDKKTHLNTNYSIDILKNKNYSSFHNLENENTINNSRYFNIGQADNFSILNSYETLLNTHQKFTNDFFAESNVSFKNSFLKNMKNKTTFRNMRIMKNSFSQSTIHMNDFNPDISKSNLNFYRNSMENINLNNKRKSGLMFKSNTNYNQYGKINEKLFNRNNYIFDIDEEKDYEEVAKNKTLNKMILNHLNRDSFTNKLSEKTLNKKKLRLELNLDDPKIYLSQKLIKDSRTKFYQDQEEHQHININNNELEKIAEGFEIFPTEKLTEKSAEYKVVTEIIENIKLLPDENNDHINEGKDNYLKKKKSNEGRKDIDNQYILFNESNKLNVNFNNNKFEKESDNGRETNINGLQNKNKDMLLMRNFSDDLVKRIKNNNNYNVDNLIMQRENNKKDKTPKKNDLGDSLDSKDSLFETKVLKFNLRKNSNSPFKKKNSDNVIGSSKKDNKLDEAVIHNKNKISNIVNPRFQIHQNYNLSIINRRERIIRNNENFAFNRNLMSSLPEIFFYSNKRKSSQDSITKNRENSNSKKRKELKSHDRYSLDLKNKLFEESKKIPEFSVINYENNNMILKNKLDYTRDDIEFNKRKSTKPLTRNGTIELKNLFADSSFNLKDKRNEDVNLNLKRHLSNNNYLYNKYSSKKRDGFSARKEDFGDDKDSEERKKDEKLFKVTSKKLSQAGSAVINNTKPEANKAFDNDNQGFAFRNSVSKNHFKAQNHAVLRAFGEVQKENLEIIEKKINEYVDEYNKRFVDFSFKKKKNKFIETDEYKENLNKMREEIIKLNP